MNVIIDGCVGACAKIKTIWQQHRRSHQLGRLSHPGFNPAPPRNIAPADVGLASHPADAAPWPVCTHSRFMPHWRP